MEDRKAGRRGRSAGLYNKTEGSDGWIYENMRAEFGVSYDNGGF